MLDYEEYGSSFRTPRALRDGGAPANNTFNQYDGNNTQPEGRPPTQPVSPDDEEAKKKAAATAQQPQAAAPSLPQATQTFAQMQQAGIARPPAPTPKGAWESFTPSITPMDAGGSMVPYSNMPSVLKGQDSNPANGGDMESTLKGAWEGYTPQTFGTGKDTEMQQRIRDALMQSIGAPSRYDSDVAKKSFDQLSGDIDDDYNTRDQNLRESIASRGLGAVGDGTIGTSSMINQNLARRSAKQRMATDILREQANTYGADRSSAIRDAMGYGNDQFGNQLSQAQFNAQQKQQAYNNYTGYGQQAFENQTTAADMKAKQQQQQYDMLMKILGIS